MTDNWVRLSLYISPARATAAVLTAGERAAFERNQLVGATVGATVETWLDEATQASFALETVSPWWIANATQASAALAAARGISETDASLLMLHALYATIAIGNDESLVQRTPQQIAAEAALWACGYETGMSRPELGEDELPEAVVRWVNDDTAVVLIHGRQVAEVDYETYGAEGMRRALDLFRDMATHFGLVVMTEGTPGR